MNRRAFLGTSAAAVLGAQNSAPHPNILLILADDLGYGDLGCYGQQRIATPNIDRLAAEGVRFTQAYAGSTVCAPSRCCLMTGKHTGHATVRGNMRPEAGLSSGETTLPEVLKQAGYETALFGKWGLGGPATGSTPNQRGFDKFFGYLDQLHAHNYYPEHLWENQNEFFLTNNWFDQRKQYAPDLFRDRAVQYLDGRHTRPFFLCLTTTIPHADDELGALRGNGMEVPSDAPYTGRDWPQVEKQFAAMVTRLDQHAGDILAALKRSGAEENTVVLFSSDNGPHKEGGHDPNFFASGGPLRGIKRDLYEGGIRIPLIARWPGRIKPSTISRHAIAFWDFLPTAADLAGTKPPGGLDGISMLPALLGQSQKQHEYFYWEFHERGFSQAVRLDDWKGVRTAAGRPIELYNLRSDLAEKNDVAAANPEIVRRVAGLMNGARVDSPKFRKQP
ncbi:MAG: arylsulfatase [Bryobacteraceae bacterium]